MGRRSNRRWKDKRENKKRNKAAREGGDKKYQAPYDDGYVKVLVDHGNFKMEAYYALQGMHDHYYNGDGKLVPCETDEEKEAERLRWRKTSQEILPSSFRIASDIPESLQDRLMQELEELIPHPTTTSTDIKNDNGNEDTDDVTITKTVIPFLPRAFQLNMDKKSIRKSDKCQKLHLWLKQQTEAGFITRQETVSMIPPVVLAPHPDDSVLDMCASPGSKSSQLLEKLGREGSLVANDSNAQRAFMLVHQLRRIMHLNPVVLITCCEAQFFPQTLSFDKILSDVPCSGDGTTRKNAGIWKSWNQLSAMSLHALQVDIAWKGIQLLKVGSTMCYSTCSYNPTENEAVVAELLRRAKGSLELVLVRTSEETTTLKGFKTRPGWNTWKVLCEDQSQKQRKDKLKKNNEKMQAKRKEWEQKEAAAKAQAESSTNNSTANTADKSDNGIEKTSEAGKGEYNGDDCKVDTDPMDEDDGGCTEKDNTTEKNDNGNVEEEKGEEKKKDRTGDGTLEEKDNITKEDGEENKGGDDTKKEDDERGEKKEIRRFQAPSWEEENLLQLAKSAGLNYFPSVEDVPKNLKKRARASCFPPSKEEQEQFHLERCIRCFAHDNDTGGFFVALLRKVASISNKERKGMEAETGKNASADIKEEDDNVIVEDDNNAIKEEEKDDQKDKETSEPDLKRMKPNSDDTAIAMDNNTTTAKTKDNSQDKQEDKNDTVVEGSGATSAVKESAGERKETEVDDNDNGDTARNNKEDTVRGRVKRCFLKDLESGKKHTDLGKDDFVPVEASLFDPLIEYYGLTPETFPKEQYMARACGKAKVLYYIGKPVKDMIDLGIQKRVTIINSGVKGFVRNNKENCEVTYRIAQEGVHFLVPYMSDVRKISVDKEDFEQCMVGEGAPIDLKNFSEDFQTRIRSLSVGAVVIILKGYETLVDKKMILTMWRCRGDTINCLVSKPELAGMKSKLDGILHNTT